MQTIADQIDPIQKAMTSSERLFNLLDVPPEVVDKPNPIHVDTFKGKIEFKNVWFAYEGEDWILRDVSFVIEPRQTVAFVGATGAGKTTILSLIVNNKLCHNVSMKKSFLLLIPVVFVLSACKEVGIGFTNESHDKGWDYTTMSTAKPGSVDSYSYRNPRYFRQ